MREKLFAAAIFAIMVLTAKIPACLDLLQAFSVVLNMIAVYIAIVEYGSCAETLKKRGKKTVMISTLLMITTI